MTKRKKILITGSLGKVGKVLVEGLKSKFTIYEIDKKLVSSKRKLNVDISDENQLKQISGKTKDIKYLIHLAADPRPSASWDSVLKNNIVGTKNIYDFALENKVEKVIFASTNQTVKGYLNEGLGKVDTFRPPRPVNYYSMSKAVGEMIARTYYEVFGLCSICLRLGTVIEDDIPKEGTDFTKWLSHRDLVNVVKCALKSKIAYGVYFAVSDNANLPWDTTATKEELGFKPMDNASKFMT